MPDFATARGIQELGKKLSLEELIRAIRFSVAAEYEAIQIYEQIVEATDNPHVIAIVKDIINEEKLHAGQFLDILFEIAPEEKKPYDDAVKENKELREKTDQ